MMVAEYVSKVHGQVPFSVLCTLNCQQNDMKLKQAVLKL